MDTAVRAAFSPMAGSYPVTCLTGGEEAQPANSRMKSQNAYVDRSFLCKHDPLFSTILNNRQRNVNYCSFAMT